MFNTSMSKRVAIIENHVISVNTVRRGLVEALQAYGYKVTILSTGTAEELLVSRKLGFKVVDVSSSNVNPLHVAKYLQKLRRTLKKIKADIVLTYTMRPAIWGNMITGTLGIPTITNITGTGPLGSSNSFPYRIARLLYTGLLKKTKIVFFQNEDDKSIFLEKKFVSEGQCRLIPGSGVDVNYFAPQALENTASTFTFLFISRLIKDKGILEFVEAARILKQKGIKVNCSIIGPYWTQNLKENSIDESHIAAWEAEGIINYLGAAQDVRPFIAAADCLVLPSYREGMSNVLLEASSMQKPCIASNVTGCKEIIVDGETGFLTVAKDAQDVADKMLAMYNMPATDRLEMGKKARERVTLLFNKEIVIQSYLKAIEEFAL